MPAETSKGRGAPCCKRHCAGDRRTTLLSRMPRFLDGGCLKCEIPSMTSHKYHLTSKLQSCPIFTFTYRAAIAAHISNDRTCSELQRELSILVWPEKNNPPKKRKIFFLLHTEQNTIPNTASVLTDFVFLMSIWTVQGQSTSIWRLSLDGGLQRCKIDFLRPHMNQTRSRICFRKSNRF